MSKFLSSIAKFRNFWNTSLLALTFILLLAGGLGLYLQNVTVLGAAAFVAGLLLLLFLGREVLLPRSFLLFFTTLVLLGISTVWSQDRLATLGYFVLFASGGAFWLLLFNLGAKFKQNFGHIIVILGIVFGLSYLINLLVFPQVPVRPWTLYLPSTFSRNHNHLGDLWALVLVVIAHGFLTKPKWWHWLLTLVGVYFLAVSLSRSAYLALGVGIFYLFNKLGLARKYRKIFTLFLFVAAALFLYAALFKSTIFARPYFEQVIYGLSKWPWGVGVGNFGIISLDTQGPWWNGPRTGIFSSSTHNIILEMVAGMGYLGLLFAAWLAHELWYLLKNENARPLFTAVFLAASANFMFDTTYSIPTMLWIWFASLGLAQPQKEKRKFAKIYSLDL